MNRILFVDDEAAVLDGLRDSLRKQRDRWDMVFVASGADALQELAKAPFDLVLTDMRMPQMDGAELLRRVKAEHPGTARIVLSGHAEQAAILRTLPVAHQFLAKPCDPQQLRTVIERTCHVHALLQKGRAQQVIGGLDTLPSVPRTYQKLQEAMADPALDIGAVVAIVEQDPAMCVKILQLVNSAYFGLARPMSSIRQAVTYLGLELIKALALTAHVFSSADSKKLRGLSIDELQRHSMLMARLMRRFFAEPRRSEEAFTAALVHDIGTIVLVLGFGERYEAVSARTRAGEPGHVAEAELLGVTHAEVGAYLLGIWGLPFAVVEAVALHHRPGDCADGSGAAGLLAALHVADTFTGGHGSGRNGAEAALDRTFLERAGCLAELPRWCELAAQEPD